jgi:hypothetical protein
MSVLRVQQLMNEAGTGPVEFTKGATLPSGSQLNVQGNINATGISTVGSLSATGINVTGVMTATTFVGDGSGVTNIPLITTGKAIGIAVIGS